MRVFILSFLLSCVLKYFHNKKKSNVLLSTSPRKVLSTHATLHVGLRGWGLFPGGLAFIFQSKRINSFSSLEKFESWGELSAQMPP